MPALVSKVQADLVSAMKNKEEVKLLVLRMLKSSIQLAQVEKGKDKELSDDEVIVILRRLIKQRNEAAEMYKSAGAADRAEQELAEAVVLSAYLPAQLSDEDLDRLVAEVAAAVGAASMRDMGKVMGKAMAEVKGLADGNRVRESVQSYLSSLS